MKTFGGYIKYPISPSGKNGVKKWTQTDWLKTLHAHMLVTRVKEGSKSNDSLHEVEEREGILV